MSEQTDRSDTGDDTPIWNSWAWGMALGLIALFLAFYGVSRVMSLGSDWAHIAQDFDHTCQARDQLTSDIQSEINANAYWRARHPRLAGHPHPYPSTPAVSEWIFADAQQPQRLSPHIRGPHLLTDLLQQPIALNEQQNAPYHYTCHQSVAPAQVE